MKKFLFMLCLCLVFTLCIPATAFASEAAGTAEDGSISGAESEATPDTPQSDHSDQENSAEENAEANAFLMLYEQIRTHLPEVFSALSLLGACILAFCYKRGLLPILRDGIGAIGSTTQEFKKNAEIYAKDTKEICENTNNSIQFTNSCIEKMQSSIEAVEEKLAALGDQKSESEIFKELIRGQVDMLYDIFLTSSLPQFEKDRVGKRVEEMRRMLEKRAVGEESNAEE